MREIITFGRGYSLSPGIKVFVKSAKKFCDKLTIICSDLKEELVEFLKEQNVNIVQAKELAEKYNVNMSISPYTLKVIFFYLYCKHKCQSEEVYLCDFTDIFFQKNLFDLIVDSKPYVTSENFLISNCPTNTTWLNTCYNADIFNLLKKYEILNGGSILGEKASVIHLLKEMCDDMACIISRIGNYPNIDQASLNKVVYFDQHRYNILKEAEIFNLAHYGHLFCDLEKSVITIGDKEPFVIHQYDVIKSLENYLYEQFN